MAGIVVITSWERLIKGLPADVLPMQRDLGRFFKGARKARKHLRRAEGYYR